MNVLGKEVIHVSGEKEQVIVKFYCAVQKGLQFQIWSFLYLFIWERAHDLVYIWRPEDNLWMSFLFFHHMDPKGWTRVVKLGVAAGAFTHHVTLLFLNYSYLWFFYLTFLSSDRLELLRMNLWMKNTVISLKEETQLKVALFYLDWPPQLDTKPLCCLFAAQLFFLHVRSIRYFPTWMAMAYSELSAQ